MYSNGIMNILKKMIVPKDNVVPEDGLSNGCWQSGLKNNGRTGDAW